MIKQIVTVTFLVFGFALSNQMFAQTKDSGIYTVYVGDQLLAEENYTSENVSGGIIKTVSKVAATTFTTATKDNKPIEFTIETGGTQILRSLFANGEATTAISGQLDKTIKTPASVILENGVWSQFIDLLAQYDRKKSGVQNFVGFLPSQLLGIPLTLEKSETKDFKINGQTIAVSKYKLVHTKSGLSAVVWADNKNIPLLIEIPAQQVQVVRTGFEDLRGMLAPTKTQMTNFTGEFTSEEVSFPNGANTLSGTLTVPKSDKKPFPAIVIITGSGGQDRDGAQLFNLYKKIAESLSQAGVAVLRVDDRGTGKSTMDMTKAAETSYKDLISDSRAAFDFLTTRKGIDKSKIGFLGHSEGAETALTIAAEDKRVAAIILMAGVSRPINEGVVEQDIYQRAMQETVNVSDKTKVMPLVQTLLKQFEDAKLPQNVNNAKFSWFREHLASNSTILAAKIKCPVMIVQGERDALVLAYHSIELAKVLSANGNKNVSLRILPNLTHIFTSVSEKPEEASKISEEMLQTLQNWAFANLIENTK